VGLRTCPFVVFKEASMRNMNNPDVCLLNNQQHTKEARMAEKDLA